MSQLLQHSNFQYYPSVEWKLVDLIILEFDYLSQLFVDELTPVLVKIPYISLKDFSQVKKMLTAMEPEQANIIDLSIVQKLGEKIDANYILYGNYVIIKEDFRITCNIADVKSGTIINSYKHSFNFTELTKLLDTFPDSILLLIQNSNLIDKQING